VRPSVGVLVLAADIGAGFTGVQLDFDGALHKQAAAC